MSLSKGVIIVIEDDSFARSKELTLVEPYLEEAPLEEFYSNVVMDSAYSKH